MTIFPTANKLLVCGVLLSLVSVEVEAQEKSGTVQIPVHRRQTQIPAHLSPAAKQTLSLSREQFTSKYIEGMEAYHLKAQPELKTELEQIGSVPCYWVTGPNGNYRDDAVIVYFHGGSYSLGDAKEAAGCFLPVYEQLGIRGLSVQYRLADKHPFPAALHDAVEVYEALLKRDINPKRIVFMGDSAGGGLALAATLRFREQKVPLPAALVLVGAWVNLSPNESDTGITLAEWDTWQDIADDGQTVPAYAGTNDLKNPLISPLHADLKGVPPLLIHAGTREIDLSDCARLAAKARESGVDVTFDVWDGMWHVFHLNWPQVPESRRACKSIADFLGKHFLAEDSSAMTEIRTLFTEYNDNFSRGRSMEISKSNVQAPFRLAVNPPVTHASASDVDTFYKGLITSIRAEGYDHSEIVDLDIRVLNPHSAIADLTYRRYLQNGTVMGNPNRKATYLVLRTDAGWRITALIPVSN